MIYVPFLRQPFSTVGPSVGDWLRRAAVGSSVLWLDELGKIVVPETASWRRTSRPRP